MLFKLIKVNKDVRDEEFDCIYPEAIRKVADTHFTPIQVSKFAAEALADRPDTKILDIGAGVGKFCTVGTKIVTYYSFLKEIPESYSLQLSAFNEKLKVWKKTD